MSLINSPNNSDDEDSSEEEDSVISEGEIDENKSEIVDDNKKKRGRKPKPKNDNEVTNKEPKKRGRKPKEKDENALQKVPKKRGRKPKEKIYSVKELPKTFFEENKNETLILHLPITSDEINIDNNDPQPDFNKGIEYSLYSDEYPNYKMNNNLLPTQSNLLNYQDNGISHDSIGMAFGQTSVGINEIYNDTNSINNIIYDSNLNNLNNIKNDKIDKQEETEDETKTNKIIKKNLRNILYEFINSNNEKTWPSSTNIYCWWCCHPFTNTPCALPEYYKKDKFYVSGVYCSFNCAASYNFSKNDDNIWERYSLLNLMYKKLYNQKFIKINLAPPRESLKIFGGYMNVEEFRENCYKNEKIFAVINPPLISIIPKIEENVSAQLKTNKNNFPLINESILNKTQNSLKLKRNKPVTNPNNTLQSYMDLKII
jgi:hypothetical protein